MQLLLIRHALPLRVENEEGVPADPELSPDGHRQAAAMAEYLAAEPLDAVYASPLRRARETAEHLGARLGLDVVVDPELAEFDQDSHFYVPVEELRELKDERWDAMVSGRWGMFGDVDPATFQTVVVQAVEHLIAANAGRTIAAVCHGGVINGYLAHVMGTREPMFFEPFYASISRVMAARSGERMVRSINEHAHVRSLL